MELVFEIFSEEIPARMQLGAQKSLEALATKELKSAEIDFQYLNSFVTPRRLALIVKGLNFSHTQIEKFVYKKGPKLNATAQEIEDFKASFHSQKFEIIEKDIQGEKYLFAKLTKQKEEPDEIIKNILEQILQSFPWPKSMRWERNEIKWVRPIRNILCLLNGKTLPVKYGDLVANNLSFGHRFLAPQSFSVKSSEDYLESLKQGKVMIDFSERKSEITRQIADKLGPLKIVADEGLLEENAGLVEYPYILLGDMDKKFLDLPREVITCALKIHQKYFVVEDAHGKLAPHFLVVSNMTNGVEILKGNQKVLRARLDDAQFFFNEDSTTSLESRIDALKKIIFHEKIGTVFDKMQQSEKILEKISTLSPIKFDLALAQRAAKLSKADLTTNLVREFPELQGVIGKYYAEADGENIVVSQAIADHYLPKGTEEAFPTSIEGGMLALADKLSTLVSLFAAGEIPTSSKDPYALRRQAVGIVKLLCHFKISLDMKELIDYALAMTGGDGVSRMIIDFLFNRFKFFLKDQFKSTLIEAVLATSKGNFYSDFNKLTCLTNFISSKEGAATLLSIKRISNILDPISKIPSTMNEKLFNEYEQNLLTSLTQAQSELQPLLTSENHEEILKIFSKLSAIIDILFDKVLIMNDDEQVRDNRLCLLNKTKQFFLSFIDFSHIDNTA